uniref:Uncharacterized protein n=1 Tax=Geospiza parvula TaxID=87175 RepID=A0A8U8BVJ9_GEOPR
TPFFFPPNSILGSPNNFVATLAHGMSLRPPRKDVNIAEKPKFCPKNAPKPLPKPQI